MPFSFHDKPKPSDKYRGKTRDEFLDGVRDKFDQEKKMFFEKGPPWESMPSAAGFSRGGFFDDDMMGRGGRGDIRSHLDDLAQRHPEFASQLRGPAWSDEMWKGGEDEGGPSGSQAAGNSSSDPRQDQERTDEPGPLRGRPRNLPQHGLRNTVPDMGQCRAEEERSQRSWSAPPDNRSPQQQQRFVSRIDINPVNPEEGAGAQAPDNQGKPPPVPKQQQQQPPLPPQQPKSAGNVRHIPIFVEGRDEPILPKNLDTDPEPASHQQHFTSQAQHQFQQQKRPSQQGRSFNTSPKPFQQPPAMQADPPEPPAVPHDPISRVHAIQREVAALEQRVERYSGSSRREKEYVYLDEMLTRNLIKLDDIETEGKENVRVARKEAIRCIQRCIGILEGKVPQPTTGDSEIPAPAVDPALDPIAAPTDVAESAAPSKTDEEQPKDNS